jgi:hypothetical protein
MVKLTAFAILGLCACATAAKKGGAESAKVVLYSSPGAPQPEGKVVCANERPTGSNIAERVCRYQNQAQWSAQSSQDMMLNLQRRPCTTTTGQVPGCGQP